MLVNRQFSTPTIHSFLIASSFYNSLGERGHSCGRLFPTIIWAKSLRNPERHARCTG